MTSFEVCGFDLARSVATTGVCRLTLDGGSVVGADFSRPHDMSPDGQDAFIAQLSRDCIVAVDGPPVHKESAVFHGGRYIDAVAKDVANIDPWPPSRIAHVAARACHIWGEARASLCPTPPVDGTGLVEVYPRAWVGQLAYKETGWGDPSAAREMRNEIADFIAGQLGATDAVRRVMVEASDNDDNLDALICAYVAAQTATRPDLVRWPDGDIETAHARAEGWFLLPRDRCQVFAHVRARTPGNTLPAYRSVRPAPPRAPALSGHRRR